MISVEEARRLIRETVPVGAAVDMALPDATGLYLAEAIHSKYPLPMFDNSAMDGYAVIAGDLVSASPERPVQLRVAGEAAAGSLASVADAPLQSGQVMRIFTGAPVPAGADAVVRQEDVELRDGVAAFCSNVVTGANIRRRCEELREGELLLKAGEKLNAAALGLLAAAGCGTVKVVRPPRVSVAVTGSEIVAPETAPAPGQIFDSNSYVLRAALQQTGVEALSVGHVQDDRGALLKVLGERLAASDVVLVTGGVSVGDYDYVKDVAAELGLETLFWKIKQKPGKPFFFAATAGRDKLLFGLPGNPASVLVCFYQYVRPALLQWMGAADTVLLSIPAPLKEGYEVKGNLTHFLKGRLNADGRAEILKMQGSHTMSSFALANCLVVLPEGKNRVEAGESVEVQLLPL